MLSSVAPFNEKQIKRKYTYSTGFSGQIAKYIDWTWDEGIGATIGEYSATKIYFFPSLQKNGEKISLYFSLLEVVSIF